MPVKGFRLHSMPAWLNLVVITSMIYTQFDRSNSTSQIWGKSIEIDAGRFGCKFIEITLHAWSNLVVITSMIYTQFDQSIGCKSIEITLPVKGFRLHSMPAWSNLVVNGFTPNLTGH